MKRALVSSLILLLISFSADSALRPNQGVAYQGTPVPITQLGPKRSGPRWSFTDVSGITDPLRVVIRDRDAWREMWKRVHHGRLPELPSLPEIDFSREVIVVAALGGRPTGGYGIIIDGAYERNDRLEIIVHTVSPGKNCGVFPMGTAPIDIVRLQNIGHSVSFQETDIVHECK